ncbi:hypothetical protein RLW55_08850 [Hyphomicrobium sp. B1]|uniref:hypothetical protein n=1 Tax=Hyphomicrobium sp. B1 TaxID=3075651 RepID=UPI003C2FC2C7
MTGLDDLHPTKRHYLTGSMSSGIAPAFETLHQVVVSYDGSTLDLLTLLIERLYATVFTSDVELLARIIISEGRRFPVISELYHQLLVRH